MPVQLPSTLPIRKVLALGRRWVSTPVTRRLFYRLRYGPAGLALSPWHSIPGWTTREEAAALAQASYRLVDDAVVVEVGSFLGKSSVVLAGARRLRGSGKLHCVDPFDGSGDPPSVPSYQAIAAQSSMSLRERFEANIRDAALENWIVLHQGIAETIAREWAMPVDMLFLDGDQSPSGARVAYEAFAPHVKAGGIVALHNSSDRVYVEGHDGYRRLVLETVRPPEWVDIRCIDSTTLARRADPGATVRHRTARTV